MNSSHQFPCDKYHAIIEDTAAGIKRIESALLGDLTKTEETGFIPRVNNRLSKLESAKCAMYRIIWLAIGAAITGTVAATFFSK